MFLLSILLRFFLLAIPCFMFARILHQVGIQGSWMGYMLCLFQGKEPIVKTSTGDRIDLPMLWLLVTSGCLFINLDYHTRNNFDSYELYLTTTVYPSRQMIKVQ